jgi:hypothetical protein
MRFPRSHCSNNDHGNNRASATVTTTTISCITTHAAEDKFRRSVFIYLRESNVCTGSCDVGNNEKDIVHDTTTAEIADSSDHDDVYV